MKKISGNQVRNNLNIIFSFNKTKIIDHFNYNYTKSYTNKIVCWIALDLDLM